MANLDGVQHERARKYLLANGQMLDDAFLSVASRLETEYYIDKTLIKAAFDRLHGGLWWVYSIALQEANEALPLAERYDVDDLDGIADATGRVTKYKSADALPLWKALSLADRTTIKTKLSKAGITLKQVL